MLFFFPLFIIFHSLLEVPFKRDISSLGAAPVLKRLTVAPVSKQLTAQGVVCVPDIHTDQWVMTVPLPGELVKIQDSIVDRRVPASNDKLE